MSTFCDVFAVVVCVEGLQMKPLNRPNTLRARRVDLYPFYFIPLENISFVCVVLNFIKIFVSTKPAVLLPFMC
jgi:hypothetical protein